MLRNLVVTNLIVTSSWAFMIGVSHTVHDRSIGVLSAKKTASTKKKPSSSSSSSKKVISTLGSGGGFGRVVQQVEEKEVVQDDYAFFPRLDLQVQQTILPYPDELQISGPLPSEVYDRLDQIYGFPNFNFPTLEEQEQGDDAIFSFDDLFSTATPTTNNDLTSSLLSSTTTSNSKMSNLEFADLLASATGDKPSSSLSSSSSSFNPNSPTIDSRIDAIANLPQFSNFRVLHVDPLVLAVDDFFTDEECDRYITMSETPPSKGKDNNDAAFQTRSKTVGKDHTAQAQRTSTTWFHHYRMVPELMSKASRLFGLDRIDQWEEPQTVRYRRNEKFTWHLDALSPQECSRGMGGQRTATLLVYLTDLKTSDGGATIFRDLAYDNGDRLRV